MDIYPTSDETGTFTLAAELQLDGPVQVAVLPRGRVPTSETAWVDAAWLGSPDINRQCSVRMVGRQVTPVPSGAIQVPKGRHQGWVMLADKIIRQSSGQVVGH